MTTRATLTLALTALLAAGLAPAQEKAAPPPRPQTPLQVKVVLTRQPAGKPVTRLPYMISCLADGPRTSLRMGIETPVPVDGGKSFQYHNVGLNLTCDAKPAGDGAYRLGLDVEQSSLGEPSGGNPTFQSFNSTFTAVLRDGQGGVQAVATDPVSGQEATIEVSLKVLK